VILVGAGPGDPGLITVRGAEALGRADAVVYDALAAHELLDLAPPDAQRINVGKRGHDDPTRPQPDTNALLIGLANEGKTVVRLKGGDPFVFGRGGEEAAACVAAGVAFEVVPGVSSATAALAYAGIPVTDRRHSASFAVVTGHKDPTRVSEQTRWQELARAADTLVILMGMRGLDDLVARIAEGGREPQTPAAAVMNGTLPNQRVVEAPLAELPAAVRAAGLGAPAVVVIGDVVKLRAELAWFEQLPLFGRRVVVTRAADQAHEIVSLLRSAGAEAVRVPMIALTAPEDMAPLDAGLAEWSAYDGVLFSSVNAVRAVVSRARQTGVVLESRLPRIACVGPKTAHAARAAGLGVALVPETDFEARGLARAVDSAWGAKGLRLWLPQAERARSVLADSLREVGARVETAVAYRTVPAEVDPVALREQLVSGSLDAVTFTSPSTVAHFAEQLDDEAHAAARRCCLAAIGPVTANALEGVGLAADLVAPRATMPDLVDALAAHFAHAHAANAHFANGRDAEEAGR
jgi:uroporphyrinogen III methyltransferase/synthase